MPKYLLTFAKHESVRWLGHLDILRTFERAVRRAGLPVAFSAGFNPRERVAFASALATGITGSNELASIEMTADVSPDTIRDALNAALPPGLRIEACIDIPDAGSRDLLNAYSLAEYEVVCSYPPECTEDQLDAAVAAVLAEPAINIVREREGRKRTVDIRPLLKDLRVTPGSVAGGRCSLEMTLALGESGTLRPGEVVAAVEAHAPELKLRRAHRRRLLMRSADEGDSQAETACTEAMGCLD